MRVPLVTLAVMAMAALMVAVSQAAAQPGRETVLELATMAPFFEGEPPVDIHIRRMMEWPGSEGKGSVAEVKWSADGEERTGLAFVGALSLDPPQGWLATREEWGLLRFHEDKTWQNFVDELVATRVRTNEASAIGDLRSVVSAEKLYFSVSGGSYAELPCLISPWDCVPGYPADAPNMLSPDFVEVEKLGYRRSFIPGTRDGSKLTAYVVTAVPLEPGLSGSRGFCADDTEVVCATPPGDDPRVENGRCAQPCEPVERRRR